ncbi:MAG: S41 family peptidase, partial [Bacteroidales bacterium]|nr:S41 family peptidase [Bacteroidales bacterium]
MIKITFLCLIVLYNLNCLAQEFPPALTQHQMYEDFDEFVHIIENANTQLPIRKAVTRYNQLDSMKLLRFRIDTIQDYYSFISLLDIALGYMYDIHAVMAKQFYEQMDDSSGVDKEVINQIYTGYRQWMNDLNETSNQQGKRWFPCNPSYIDGNYYLHGFYILINEYDTVVLKNTKIISYENIPYHNYVLKNNARFFKGSIRWDFKKNQYFSNASAFHNEGELVVEDEKGNRDTINLSAYKGIMAKQFSDTTLFRHPNFKYCLPHKREKKVLFFETDKILYIYLNDMYDAENTFIAKVKELGGNKEIEKIIIDVRGNRGGGDPFWHQLLKAIVADSLIYDVQMAFCNSELMRERLGAHAESTSLKVQMFHWLPDVELLVTQYTPTYFVPDSNSLQYKGKIYVLQDEDVFSSGLSLTTYCSHVEQLVSVGEPTGLLAGFGLTPFLYQLKNSKFSFRLEPAVDITKANSALDVYQDFP